MKWMKPKSRNWKIQRVARVLQTYGENTYKVETEDGAPKIMFTTMSQYCHLYGSIWFLTFIDDGTCWEFQIWKVDNLFIEVSHVPEGRFNIRDVRLKTFAVHHGHDHKSEGVLWWLLMFDTIDLKKACLPSRVLKRSSLMLQLVWITNYNSQNIVINFVNFVAQYAERCNLSLVLCRSAVVFLLYIYGTRDSRSGTKLARYIYGCGCTTRSSILLFSSLEYSCDSTLIICLFRFL